MMNQSHPQSATETHVTTYTLELTTGERISIDGQRFVPWADPSGILHIGLRGNIAVEVAMFGPSAWQRLETNAPQASFADLKG